MSAFSWFRCERTLLRFTTWFRDLTFQLTNVIWQPSILLFVFRCFFAIVHIRKCRNKASSNGFSTGQKKNLPRYTKQNKTNKQNKHKITAWCNNSPPSVTNPNMVTSNPFTKASTQYVLIGGHTKLRDHSVLKIQLIIIILTFLTQKLNKEKNIYIYNDEKILEKKNGAPIAPTTRI